MTWTPDEQRAVKRALLGSWPGTITQWGKDAFAAYMGELIARGLSAERVLFAIRTWPAGSDFPPSAPNLAAAALHDPSLPTFEEAVQLVYGRGGVLRAPTPKGPFADYAEMQRAQHRARLDRAGELHPLVAEFVTRFGVDRLAGLAVEGEWAEATLRRLRDAWERHLEASEGRQVAEIARRSSRGDLGRLDPLAALGVGRREIEQSTARSDA